jgi:hypothetical protein
MIMGIDRVVVGRESLFTNREVAYDPVAPVSKRTKQIYHKLKFTDHDIRGVGSLLLSKVV